LLRLAIGGLAVRPATDGAPQAGPSFLPPEPSLVGRRRLALLPTPGSSSPARGSNPRQKRAGAVFLPRQFWGFNRTHPHALRQVHPWPGLPTAAGGWTLSGACCHGAGHTHVEAGMAAERQGSRRRKHLGYSFLTLRLSSRYRWFIKKPFIWTRP